MTSPFARYDCVEPFLLEGKPVLDVNQRAYGNDDAPLHVAVRRFDVDEVIRLLELGANVNLPGDIGYTPLHYAAGWGRIDMVEVLLKNGADPTRRDEFGATALHIAEGKHPACVRLIENWNPVASGAPVARRPRAPKRQGRGKRGSPAQGT